MSVVGCKGYQRTLFELKERLGDVLGWRRPGAEPSVSALCQARQKLDAKRCASISAHVQGLCTTARQHAGVGYGGFRLLAVDGTKLALPAYRAMREHFGGPTTADGAMQGPQAALTVLWDVGANLPVDWRLGAYRVSERVHALELVASLQPKDLLIGDRGMLSRRLLHAVRERGADLLMRVRSSGTGCLREVAEFLASNQHDAVVLISQRDHHGRDQDVPPITVRLLRHVLPDGSIAVFLTTLCDQQQHPAGDLIALYTQRWRIETAFRELKLWHGLERFHARKPDGIAQEVCAIMVFQMLASELEARARVLHRIDTHQIRAEQATQPQPPTLRFNRRIVADSVVDIIFAASKGDHAIDAAFQQAMFVLWRYRQVVRPRRSFPRRRLSPPRGWKTRGTKGKGRP